MAIHYSTSLWNGNWLARLSFICYLLSECFYYAIMSRGANNVVGLGLEFKGSLKGKTKALLSI